MKIAIPTMGRVNAQLTWNALPPEAREEFSVVVVCEASEYKELRKQGINAVAYTGRGDGIGAKRQWILDKMRADPILCMFDDDLNVWARRLEQPTVAGGAKYVKASPADIVKGLRTFENLMKEYTAGALGGRGFSQGRPLIDKNPARLVRALGYNLEQMPKSAKFRMPTCEDLDMQLQLLTAGCSVFMYYGLVQEQKGSNLPGGCSAYRDLDFQAEQYRQLHEYHPQFTTLTQRTYRKGWEGMSRTQPSININWRAAAAFGKRSVAA